MDIKITACQLCWIGFPKVQLNYSPCQQLVAAMQPTLPVMYADPFISSPELWCSMKTALELNLCGRQQKGNAE